jgi:hypothetical protein
MMIRKWVMIAITALAVTTVAAKEKPKPVVMESPNYVLAAPPSDQAQLVFVEPINKIQGLFPIAIYELIGEQRSLLAVSWWKGKTVVLLPPGKHMLFATPGGLGHVMEANVEAGKRYYVLLRFIYANGMQMRPIRTSGASPYRTTSPDFPKWLKETRWVEKTPDAEAFFAGEKVSAAIDQGLQAAMNNWQSKTAAEAAELTLVPGDAVAE